MAETAYQKYRRFLSDPGSTLGIAPTSRAGSALRSAAQYVGEQVPVAIDLNERYNPLMSALDPNNPRTGVNRLTKYLFEPQPVLGDPGHPKTMPPSMRRPALDFDSVPSADEHGVTDFIRRAPEELKPVFDKFTGQNMPGIRIRPSDLTTRTEGDAQAIDRLRRTGGTSLRPLLAAPGEGGGPMSLADMEGRQRAMQALDDFFTNEPQAQRIEQARGRAEENQAEMEAADPLWKQRAQTELEMGKAFGLESAKNQFAAAREQERRNAHDQAMSRIDALEAEAIRTVRAQITDPAKLQEAIAQIQANANRDRQQTREGFGIGAGLSASGLYRQDGL